MDKLRSKLLLFFFNNSILVVLVLLCIVLGIASDKFFTLQNWFNILNNFSVIGIVAIAVAIVIIGGGIDLSFGSILACCSILATLLQPRSVILPIVAAVAMGAFLGFLNGLMVTKIGTNPLVTTLGTQWLYFAALMIITEGHLVQGTTDNLFHFIGHGKIFSVPFPIYILFAVCIIVWFILKKLRIGKFIYAHGSNRNAVYSAGVNASNVYMFTFILMGMIIGIGSVVLSSRLIGIRPTEGGRYLLTILTAVILSGASLSGGIGSVVHVLIAAVVLGVIDNGMVLLAVEYRNQQVIRGCIFILSILYNNLMVRQREIYKTKLSLQRRELAA